MRDKVIYQFISSFLLVFAVVLAVPLVVSLYYGESFFYQSGFAVASVSSLVMGYALKLSGRGEDFSPTINEAMFSAVLGWILAIAFGSIPFLTHLGMTNAVFESAAGLTTTGISMVMQPSELPHSLLFWRSFTQWVGGLGILTFFIAIIRESGGVSRRLFSAEAHKTDSGSIRPSLIKSIIALWKVYGFITAVIMGTYIALGMSVFDAFLHGFSTISTGGFSTTSASIAGFSSTSIELATILFMFVGGVNFVILYRALRGEFSSLVNNSEFRLYSTAFLVVAGLTAFEFLTSGAPLQASVIDSFFQSAAVISSTGYSTVSLMSLSVAMQLVFIAVMFVGGSLGSTSGGLKMFRLKTLIELSRVRIRSYSLPKTAINEVKIDGEILEDSTVRTISVLFFTWISVVFLVTVAVMALEEVGMMAALSGSVSTVGNMGPVYLAGEDLVSLSPAVKILWVAAMLAGRLEMLPVLAIFNSDIFKQYS